MTNVRLGFPCYEHEATMSGGSWEADYPVANMVNATELARVARSTDATTASTTATATLASERGVRLVGVLFDNPSPALSVRAEGLDAADAVLVDSGWVEAFPRVYASLSLPWEAPNFWSGRYTQEELTGQRHLVVLDLGKTYWLRKVRLSFDDTANADGYLDVAYISLARLWQLERNPRYGAEMGIEDPTAAQEADGGARFYDDRAQRRSWRGEVRVASRTETMQKVYEHQRAMGLDRPFIWQPEPDLATDAIRQTWLARNRSLARRVYQAYGLYAFRLDIEEAL